MLSQLLHQESHKFLTDIGFVARPLIGQSIKIAYDYPGAVTLMLNRGNKITNFETLYKTIVSQSYENGREQGKNDAINSIMKNVTRTIFDIK
jgi:hypothetical protein